jgi:hypothetical protein
MGLPDFVRNHVHEFNVHVDSLIGLIDLFINNNNRVVIRRKIQGLRRLVSCLISGWA